MLPIQRKISPFNYSSRNGNSVKYIVLHYTGNKGDTARNNIDYFYNGNRGASAHYFVDDNSIWQSVEESIQLGPLVMVMVYMVLQIKILFL